MGYIDPIKRKEYQRQWMASRRQAWIEINGPCAVCGGSDRLEVDHIDPSTKAMQPAQIWSRRQEIRDAELSKCQVLCYECHKSRTKEQMSRPIPHGTHTGYSHHRCKCRLCKDAHAEYNRATN